jgi:hypothetical protein
LAQRAARRRKRARIGLAPRLLRRRLRPRFLLVIDDTAVPGSYRLGAASLHAEDDGVIRAVGRAAPASCAAPRGGANFLLDDSALGFDNLPPGEDLPTAFNCMISVGAGGTLDPSIVAGGAMTGQGFARSPESLVIVYATTAYSTDLQQLISQLFRTGDRAGPPCTDYVPGLDCVAVDMIRGMPQRQLPACSHDASGDCWRVVDDHRCGSHQRFDIKRASEPTLPQLGGYTMLACDGSC